jgi:ligand-binding sensor domain-containing protein
MKKALALLIVLVAIVVLPCRTSIAQIYKFQQYTTKEGLCNQFIYSIAQDKHGFIWFTTGLGLCRYDGFQFSSPGSDLPASNVTISFKDNNGNLWFGYNDGLTVKYDGIEFSRVDTSINKTAVTQIIQAPEGEILVASQTGGITRIGKKLDRFTEGFEEVMINTMCFVGDDRLLVGSQDGLYLYQYENDQMALLAKNEDLSYLMVTSIIPNNNSGYWIATESDGIFYVTVDGNHFSTLRLDVPELQDAQVQSVYEDMLDNLWISTFGEGLYRIHLSEDMRALRTSVYNSANGLGSDYVKQVYFDNQQNLWVATYGHGVACITNLAFSFFETLSPIGNNATAVLSVDNSEYWIAGTGAIIRMIAKPEPKTVVLGRANGLPPEKITVLRTDDLGNLWFGTEKSGLYKLDRDAQNASLFYREENSLSNAIQDFIFADEKIWLATRNGVLVIDPQTGRKTKQYTTFDDGLPYNNIRNIFKDSKNRIWVATNSNSLLDIKSGYRLTLPDESETEFSAIVEDNKERIWVGTTGKGVYLFDEARDTIYQFTSEDGLKTDYCYAMTFDGNGHIWIGHRLGLTSINTNRLTVNAFGVDNGIFGDVNPLAMILNKNGEMLVGMTDGVMMYDVKADQTQEQIPMLNLSQVLINDQPYNAYKPVVLPYGKYKVQFDFVGLQYSNPASVSYQYLLMNYDNGWTKLSKSTTANYPRLEDGDYSFWVKACNNDNCTEETMLFSIKIRNPYWKTWWFLLLAVVGVIGLGYVVIAIRERNHRIQQEYLENELKARTREVHKQKEEIEIKNRDITDSINYAQRIQFSVLPSTSTLLEHSSGAFIFYRPRDIVSGDFYWFEYFPETHRLLIVCADSTGHGVPGAFMSLIGTTLIKDIALRPDVHSPADILYRLDENIQSTLNQNRDSEQANDGMDIIVCEINTETRFTRISSAMRPFIVYHKGVPTTYKCSRSSIGGQRLGNKTFATTELQLAKGDTIYMFTDGYTDQFGGPSGKKLKMTRLQNILNDIYDRDMDEQHRVIKENFDLWKGNDKQIDDVLMIGVKL